MTFNYLITHGINFICLANHKIKKLTVNPSEFVNRLYQQLSVHKKNLEPNYHNNQVL